MYQCIVNLLTFFLSIVHRCLYIVRLLAGQPTSPCSLDNHHHHHRETLHQHPGRMSGCILAVRGLRSVGDRLLLIYLTPSTFSCRCSGGSGRSRQTCCRRGRTGGSRSPCCRSRSLAPRPLPHLPYTSCQTTQAHSTVGSGTVLEVSARLLQVLRPWLFIDCNTGALSTKH